MADNQQDSNLLLDKFETHLRSFPDLWKDYTAYIESGGKIAPIMDSAQASNFHAGDNVMTVGIQDEKYIVTAFAHENAHRKYTPLTSTISDDIIEKDGYYRESTGLASRMLEEVACVIEEAKYLDADTDMLHGEYTKDWYKEAKFFSKVHQLSPDAEQKLLMQTSALMILEQARRENALYAFIPDKYGIIGQEPFEDKSMTTFPLSKLSKPLGIDERLGEPFIEEIRPLIFSALTTNDRQVDSLKKVYQTNDMDELKNKTMAKGLYLFSSQEDLGTFARKIFDQALINSLPEHIRPAPSKPLQTNDVPTDDLNLYTDTKRLDDLMSGHKVPNDKPQDAPKKPRYEYVDPLELYTDKKRLDELIANSKKLHDMRGDAKGSQNKPIDPLDLYTDKQKLYELIQKNKGSSKSD